ncbi:hypothetical protein BH24ACI3_BH24ACI3_16430 [soil metagenome]
MNTSVISKIEKSIFALPLNERRKLIARVSKRINAESTMDLDERLAAMAGDPEIIRELNAIETDFCGTEMDGLAE